MRISANTIPKSAELIGEADERSDRTPSLSKVAELLSALVMIV
jgi:hypothetical protein